jgi:hypothetical protein
MPAITKDTHKKYLASPEWKARREEHFNEVPWNIYCWKCDMPRWLSELVYRQDLHVHHLSYENVGKEDPEDLQSLCARCHEIETWGKSDLPEIKSSKCRVCGCRHWDRRSDICPVCSSLIGNNPFWATYDVLYKVNPETGISILETISKVILEKHVGTAGRVRELEGKVKTLGGSEF